MEKTLLFSTPHYKIYEVDGGEIRKDNAKFSGGDNYCHNKELPKGTILVENVAGSNDQKLLILHEAVECSLMEEPGFTYDQAHNAANLAEALLRKDMLEIDEVLEVLCSALEVGKEFSMKVQGVWKAIAKEKSAGISPMLENPTLPAVSDIPTPPVSEIPTQANMDPILPTGENPSQSLNTKALKAVIEIPEVRKWFAKSVQGLARRGGFDYAMVSNKPGEDPITESNLDLEKMRALLSRAKTATLNSPDVEGSPWLREQYNTIEPSSGVVDPLESPHSRYVREALSAPGRRSNLFDMAANTRWKGIGGKATDLMNKLTEYGEMHSLGVDPHAKDFQGSMGKGIEGYFSNPQNVKAIFGREMGIAEALKTLGPIGIFNASKQVHDPLMWSKALGSAAKTPVEQEQARKTLHAVLTLNLSKGMVTNWDTKRFMNHFRGISPNALNNFPLLQKKMVETPGGLQQQFDPQYMSDPSKIPVISPEAVPSNVKAYELFDKAAFLYTEKIASHTDETWIERIDKIATDLSGDWPTAKDPRDDTDHLYHTIRKDSKTIGFVKVSPWSDGNFVSNLWIRGEHRNNGSGRTLLKRIIKAHGDKPLYLKAEGFSHSPLSQDKLEKWYQKFGFRLGTEGRMYRPGNKTLDPEQVEKAAEEKEAVGRNLDQQIQALKKILENRRPLAGVAKRIHPIALSGMVSRSPTGVEEGVDVTRSLLDRNYKYHQLLASLIAKNPMKKLSEWVAPEVADAHAAKHKGDLGVSGDEYKTLASLLAKLKNKRLVNQRLKQGKKTQAWDTPTMRVVLTPEGKIVSVHRRTAA
jgi:N-acetylglutamate synthase-like GNAT family acetyltransferase